MGKSSIEWTDETWNPVAGCDKVSAGCKHCYAETMAKRLAAMGREKYLGTVDEKGHWTGMMTMDYDALRLPLKWKKPRMVFVNSMSDLFHEGVPWSFIQEVFHTMRETPEHTYQILTKRPERMAAYLEHREGNALRNVWLGTSVENQKTADERIPWLLKCPAAVRFLSCEPLLEGLDISTYISPTRALYACNSCGEEFGEGEEAAGRCPHCNKGHGEPVDTIEDESGIHWVICGGETGVGSGIRPMHPDWARGLRDQCVEAGVPFFFKQWGCFQAVYDRDEDPDFTMVETMKHKFPKGRWLNLEGGHGFHGDRVHYVVPVRKEIAGRLLDGREWNEMPVGTS